ncbi:MAG: site-specific DNA-methyltransferase [Verrucomicrobiales bacterium]|nr:site-specific DNA-methyltransferase [Verrucomicrobiales bacterium]
MATKNHSIAFAFDAQPQANPSPRRSSKRANNLDGATWTKYSLSIWNDIKKSPDEIALRHPAIFPVSLVRRLIQCFACPEDKVVLDPFAGSGSTLVGAMIEGKRGVGFEIVQSYLDLCAQRLAKRHLPFGGASTPLPIAHKVDSRQMMQILPLNSIDLCITSPPYWDILSRKRTADYKKTRDYGDETQDLAKIHGYWEFLSELGKVFEQVFRVLKPGKYCIVNVMDLRKKDRFYPYHSDLATKLKSLGFIFDDLIIWDRQGEYNNLRPLGFPSVFRINKVHEYLLIFQKPLKTEPRN